MNPFRKILFIVIWVFCLAPLLAHAHDHKEAAEPMPNPSGDSLYQLKSEWQNQEGKKTTLSFFRGHPLVLAMAYTSCQASCPLIVENMKKIEKDLIAKGVKDVALAVFSFDSKRDTPDRLKAYAKTRNLDLKHWTLFHGSPNAVRELAAVLGIRFKEDSRGEFDHSNIVSLLDAGGVIRHQQIGLGKEPGELEEKALALSKESDR
jgi:protein SCO1/2